LARPVGAGNLPDLAGAGLERQITEQHALIPFALELPDGQTKGVTAHGAPDQEITGVGLGSAAQYSMYFRYDWWDKTAYGESPWASKSNANSWSATAPFSTPSTASD